MHLTVDGPESFCCTSRKLEVAGDRPPMRISEEWSACAIRCAVMHLVVITILRRYCGAMQLAQVVQRLRASHRLALWNVTPGPAGPADHFCKVSKEPFDLPFSGRAALQDLVGTACYMRLDYLFLVAIAKRGAQCDHKVR